MPRPISPRLIRLSDVRPEPLQWLWPGRIALGKLSIVAGDPGLGKSFLTCDLAARVSRGAPWPDGSSLAPLGGVVLMNCEDGLADTIRPRLDAHAADVSRIVALDGVTDRTTSAEGRSFDLTRDLEALSTAIDEVEDCRLVIIDPVTAYLGQQTDSHRAADVRAVLAPLAALAERRRTAVVGVSHLNKGSGPAMYRTIGSIAFTAAARSVWCVVRDRKDAERRLFLPVKNNLAYDQGGLAYTLDDGVVQWEADAVPTSIDEALGEGRDLQQADAVTQAVEWLGERLQAGPQPTQELKADAVAAGISRRALVQAKMALGVEMSPDGYMGAWQWRLPTPGPTLF
jgi:hypothetical protein